MIGIGAFKTGVILMPGFTGLRGNGETSKLEYEVCMYVYRH